MVSEFTTLQGEKIRSVLTVSLRQDPTDTGSKVGHRSFWASNYLFHVIDKVICSPTVFGRLEPEPLPNIVEIGG